MKKLLKVPVRAIFSFCVSATLTFLSGCDSQLPLSSLQSNLTNSAIKPDVVVAEPEPGPVVTGNVPASVILNRTQVPILCYHQIRDWRPTDSKRAKDYIVPVN